MPKKLHDRLAREADKKGLTGEAKQAYIFGTMNKIKGGKKPKSK